MIGMVAALALLGYLAIRGISVLIVAPVMALVTVRIDDGLPILGSYTAEKTTTEHTDEQR